MDFNSVIERIRELNEDAEIIVTSIPNTLAGMNVMLEGIPLPLGEIMAIPIDMANAYIAALCPNLFEYEMADFCSETGRTEIYLDRLLSYNGDPATIDQNMRDCVNIYDDWTFMLEYMTANMGYAGIAKGTEEYYKGLEAGYDSIMRMMQAIALDEDVVFDLAADITDSGSHWYSTIINDSIQAAVMSAMGQEYLPFVESEIETLYSDELVKLSGALYTRTVIGNGFFAHPTYEVSYVKAKTVIDVYNNKISRIETLLNALENQKVLWEKLGLKYGVKFGVIFIDKLAGVFGIENLSGTVLAQLPDGYDLDALVELLVKETGVDDETFIEKLNTALIEAEEECNVHHHSMKYVAAKSATCTKDGSKGYWYCTECGGCYEDVSGKIKIDDLSTLKIAAGHNAVLIKGSKLSGTSDRYYCITCGKYFSDADCTVPYTEKTSLLGKLLSLFR